MEINIKYLPGQVLFFLYQDRVCSGAVETVRVNIFNKEQKSTVVITYAFKENYPDRWENQVADTKENLLKLL